MPGKQRSCCPGKQLRHYIGKERENEEKRSSKVNRPFLRAVLSHNAAGLRRKWTVVLQLKHARVPYEKDSTVILRCQVTGLLVP